MYTNKECLTEMVKRMGQKLIDEADKFVGDDIKILSLDITFSVSVEAELPIITCTRAYNAPEVFVMMKREVDE